MRTPDPRPIPAAVSEPTSDPAERLAYSVHEAARLTGLSRDLLYDEMRRGHLAQQFLDIAPAPASSQARHARS